MIIRLAEAKGSIDRITGVLEEKGIIAIPTDTIYGLAVDGTDEGAVRKLMALKQREEKPFTFFMNRSDIETYAIVMKKKVIDFFVPGPLTVILRRRPDVALPLVSEKIGIRIPQHDFVMQLLNAYQKPLAVTSANVSGQAHFASPQDIIGQFGEVVLVVDSGMLHGAPSTVLDATATPPVVMRKGVIPILAIEKVYGRKITLSRSLRFNVLFVCSGNTCRSPMAEGILGALAGREHGEI
ncbi:threonylcarbamoyl-AMP synthase, partial [candidate division WOR-3 bacterium]|nr:threonylcarbamoyl-AMP synthase [candidate division WOR-3 bacterium]